MTAITHSSAPKYGAHAARFNMIEQQIRTWEVLDPLVLDVLDAVPRENFVPAAYKGLAYADLEIPLGDGQAMLMPKMEARIVQALQLKKTDTVLEIGTGSGYTTALLAALAAHVSSVEINPQIAQHAAQTLAVNKVTNISLETGNGAQGWGNAQYDVIVYTGALAIKPEAALHQLKIGGRLFAVVGAAPAMQAILMTCADGNHYTQTVLFETCIPVLLHAPLGNRFTF